MRMCMHVHTQCCMCTCTHVHTMLYVHVCTCTHTKCCMCMCACTHTILYVHVCICTHTHNAKVVCNIRGRYHLLLPLLSPVTSISHTSSGNQSYEYFYFGSDYHFSVLSQPRLLLGRKVMTNLDSIFKSRGITLPTKVHLVKAMVFPVVMYGCESWTVKKAERRRIDAFELWCRRRLLRVP